MAAVLSNIIGLPVLPKDDKEIPGYDVTLAHAQAGYKNAQEVIRFIDTKISIITGFITVSLGLPVLVIRLLTERDKNGILSLEGTIAQSPWWCTASLVLLLLGFGSGLIAFWSALGGLLPRSPAAKAGVAILFPMFAHGSKRKAHKSLARLLRGLSQGEILREYQLQLFRVGQILHEKTHLLRRTGAWFGAQITLYLLSLACLFVGRIF